MTEPTGAWQRLLRWIGIGGEQGAAPPESADEFRRRTQDGGSGAATTTDAGANGGPGNDGCGDGD